MASASPPHDIPIESVDQLVAWFATGNKPRSAWRVGAEHEKIGVIAATGMPAPYDGPNGIEAVLTQMGSRGWTVATEGTRVIALERAGDRITLEPGGQLELSGAPLADGRAIAAQLAGHVSEVSAAASPLGIAWVAVGFRPVGTLDDVPWVPKGRYAVMRAYLPTRGGLAHEMMKRTATVQANLDYADEDDAARKMTAGMGASSIVTALFACSPIAEGRDTGWVSWRARTWLDTDPDRCGLLPFVFEPGAPLFRRYAEWALDVPMFFVYRGGYRPVGGLTFRRFLADGFAGERATMADWELHLSTLFPEVRLKNYLEMRSADAGPLPMIQALPVLWKGLLYDDEACRATIRLTQALSFAERQMLRAEVPRTGLATAVPGAGGVKILDWARELVGIARAGLARIASDELEYLAPLEEIVATGRVPAEHVREVLERSGGDPAALIAALRL